MKTILRMLQRINIRIWYLLVSAAFLSVADIIGYDWQHAAPWWQIAGLSCFAVLKGTVATLLVTVWPFMLTRNRFTGVWKIIHVLLVIIVSLAVLLSFVNGLCYFLYGFGITRKMFIILSETNLQEVKEFLPGMFDGRTGKTTLCALILVVPAVALTLLWPKAKESENNPGMIRGKWGRGMLMAAMAIVSVAGIGYGCYIAALAPWGKVNHTVIGRTLASAHSVAENMRTVRELSQKARPLPDAHLAKSSHLARKVILVIGESASKGHWSAYGYPLETTPVMDSLIRTSGANTAGLTGNVVVTPFSGAAASSTATSGNLPRILSFMSDKPDQGEWYDFPTLLQLFKVYGYHTSWLSNQERSGKWSNLSGILSSDADEVRYLGSIDSEDHLTERYDDILLPAFRESYGRPDSLQMLCLHLLGSHVEYDKRYPESHTRFQQKDVMDLTASSGKERPWINKGKAATIAHYDNSILFTDSILGVIVKEIEQDTVPTVMVYLSDHGENVYDDRDYRGRDVNFTDVPFIVVANRAYADRNPEIIRALQSAEDRTFSTSSTIYLMMTLTGSSYPLYNGREDPLSPDFEQRPVYRDN